VIIKRGENIEEEKQHRRRRRKRRTLIKEGRKFHGKTRKKEL
jgi:hypothetical protein